MIVTIEKIVRNKIETKYGERESIGIKAIEEVVQDVNGDDITIGERWLNGFRDKNGETDQWMDGMKIKVLLATREYTSKTGEEKEAINFKLPEGQSSIVVEDGVEPEVVGTDPDDV